MHVNLGNIYWKIGLFLLLKAEFKQGTWPGWFLISQFNPLLRFWFNLEYNLRYGTMGNSLYSKSEYLFQLLPCLELIYALRKAFGIPVGVGRILNADEVMTYRYDPSTRTWHF